MYRVIVTGSRDWVDRVAIESRLLALHDLHGNNLVVVHGDCATGADRIAKEFCEQMGIEQDPHPANWNRYGRAAGPLRNQKMVGLGADVCVAFPLGKSSGTRGCMELAKAAGIKVLDLGV